MLKLFIPLSMISICAMAVLFGTGVSAESAYAMQQQNVGSGRIRVLPVQGNIYLLSGGGSNVVASVGADGVLLVDAGSAEASGDLLTAIQQLNIAVMNPIHSASPCVGVRCSGGPGSGAYDARGWRSSAIFESVGAPPPVKPLRYIINTSLDADHTGGNSRIGPTGNTFTGGNIAGSGSGRGSDRDTLGVVPEQAQGVLGPQFLVPQMTGQGAEIWAHDNTLARMQKNNAPAAAQPQYTFYSPRRKWDWFNGEGIELHHIPAAHTDGDTMVYFRYSDVIVAGDIYRSDSYPVIDVENGGSFEGMVNGLNKILDMSMNMWREQGGTYIVPGHGYIADETDVSIYRQMVLKIRDRVQSMVSKGMTLEQVKAARPTLDFDGRYGSPDRFIEVLYRTFSRR